ncbi:fungal-specific transcription factor domain-containing protein [Mariannaea sp. PMI_226]|nr:fungal-specific transcription factor domain-containing protein [Mariannaea sp. PMI_226]
MECSLITPALSPASDSQSDKWSDKGGIQILPFKLPSKRRPKLNQRRATRACLGCRARKVRCDVTRRQPCGNCQWTGQECTLKIHARESIQKPTQADAVARYNKPSESLQPDSPATPLSCTTRDDEKYQYSATPEGDLPITIDTSASQDIPLSPSSSCTSSEINVLDQMRIKSISREQEIYLNQLPGFIKRFGKVLDDHDWEFLRSKDALTLPNPSLQAALIEAYFHNVHPLLPVLEVDQFLRSFDARSGQLSLLLFQSVLFAASAFIDMSLLADAGFQSRTEARLAFFEKARILYDFGCEKDNLTLVQSLLLMTLWHELPDQHRSVSHWIDVAISEAFAIDLHVDPSLIQPMVPLDIQKFRRRLWWCCLVRDRLTSLGKGRHSKIRDGDWNVSMLELSDFKFDHALTEHSRLPSIVCPYPWSDGTQDDLARIFIAQVYLICCFHLFDVLLRANAWVNRLPTADKCSFESYKLDLASWHDTQLPWEQSQPLSAGSIFRDEDTSAEFNLAILRVIYYVACFRLHQARMAVLVDDPNASRLDLELSKNDLQHSVCRLGETTRHIEEVSSKDFIPALELLLSVPAADIDFITLAIDGSDSGCRCMQVVDSMGDLELISSPGEASEHVWTPQDSSVQATYSVSDATETRCDLFTDEELLQSTFKGVFMDELMPSIKIESQDYNEVYMLNSTSYTEPQYMLEGLGPLYELFWCNE